MLKIKVTGELENLINTIDTVQKYIGFRNENQIKIISSDDNSVIYEVTRKMGIYWFNTIDKIATKNNCEIRGM